MTVYMKNNKQGYKMDADGFPSASVANTMPTVSAANSAQARYAGGGTGYGAGAGGGVKPPVGKRMVCLCQGMKYEVIGNCLHCGKIQCVNEGPGPCLFCGNEVAVKGMTAKSREGVNELKAALE